MINKIDLAQVMPNLHKLNNNTLILTYIKYLKKILVQNNKNLVQENIIFGQDYQKRI